MFAMNFFSQLTNRLFPGKSESFVWHFLLFFTPIFIVLVAGISLHYFIHVKAFHDTLEKTDLLNVRLAQISVDNVISDIISDIKYLQEHNQLRNGFINTPRSKKILEDDFLSFSKNRKIYDQIRYLNLYGKEIVRVNYNNGSPIIVKENRLQQKDNRYYVSKTLALKKDTIYWSPFDLNIENQKIEEPYKPTIRIGMPVYNRDNNRTGVLILNFDGNKLINEFKLTTANIADHIMLVNQKAYWLIHPKGKYEWDFMFSKTNTFAKQHPKIWEQIKNNKELDQKLINNSLLTYASVDISPHITQKSINDKQKLWTIIAYAPAKFLNQPRYEFMNRNGLFYVILFIAFSIGSLLLARLQINKQQAEAQSEYDRSFRNILESMDLIAITLDRDAKIIFCNQSFSNLSGYLPKEICKKNWYSIFVDSNERKKRIQAFEMIFESGIGSTQGESEIIIKDCSRHLIWWSSTLSYNNLNKPVSITFIGNDITEQRFMEAELRKASQAIEQSPSTVMITDIIGSIVYSNPKFTELTGYTKEEVIGKNPRILSSGETIDEDYRELWQALKNGREWSGEFHNKKKNGELYWESARISAIKDASGEITHFLAVKEDITEKKQLTAEVEARNQEIADNQLLAGIGKMASMIAHDLRNPLSSIKMGMQILQNQTDQAIGEQEVELIHIGLEQVQYMESILSDLLSFSRPDQLNSEWLAIDKLLDTSLISIQKQADIHKVTIKTYYQTGLPTIYVDKTKIRQVFSNLIINAIEASHLSDKENQQQAEIIISAFLNTTELGTKIEVQIKDNGIGFDNSTLEKLFEPFFTTKAQGTGLGLAIVKRIIEQHNGLISIRSQYMQGTEVSISLPILPSHLEQQI
jgi:PAS domain S-box-containing protein